MSQRYWPALSETPSTTSPFISDKLIIGKCCTHNPQGKRFDQKI
ncbi:hypothetical protein [Aeromonas sobria]|nr:hypothetical protein [Aeromonas sobria]